MKRFIKKLFEKRMKKFRNRNVFLDANVICDYLLGRGYHTENAEDIFGFAQNRIISIYVSSFTFAIAYYFMRRENKSPHIIALEALGRMYKIVQCVPVDNAIIYQAIKSEFGDYEDAIQYCCALKVPKCEAIITRNAKDFMFSDVSVVSPQFFLRHHIN